MVMSSISSVPPLVASISPPVVPSALVVPPEPLRIRVRVPAELLASIVPPLISFRLLLPISPFPRSHRWRW